MNKPVSVPLGTIHALACHFVLYSVVQSICGVVVVEARRLTSVGAVAGTKFAGGTGRDVAEMIYNRPAYLAIPLIILAVASIVTKCRNDRVLLAVMVANFVFMCVLVLLMIFIVSPTMIR